jgi:AcrR family transcriptional regulator
MCALQSEMSSKTGLRERKKQKTRAAIQHQALRLFREHGYEATTVDHIAEAVEISPSTFFRYFRAKEDLVLTDDYDPHIIAAIRAQPAELGPIQAVRVGLRSVFDGLSADELSDMRDRAELALAVPELRAGMLDQLAQTIRQITDLVAERVGRSVDDFEVSTLSGAMLGVMISAEFYWVEHPASDLRALLDAALAHLELGLRI